MSQGKSVEEIIEDHDKIDIYASLFFTIFDIILYFVILCLFGCFNRVLLSIKQNISFLILIDICIRMVNIFYSSLIYFLPKEIILTIFASFQFFLIISILNQIFNENNDGNTLDKIEIKYPFLTSVFFFIFAITLKYNITLYLIQYGCAIVAILIYAFYVKRKIDFYLFKLEKKKPQCGSNNFLHNFTMFISLYFIVFYVLKLANLFVENLKYYSYMEIGIDMVKEITKYISFIMVIYFYHLHNKYNDNDSNDSRQNQTSVNISNISSISSSSFHN